MLGEKKKILAVSPHTDDIELWASGLVMRCIAAGCSVKHIVFSNAQESLPENFSKDASEKECLKAQKLLGIDDYEFYNYPVRKFPQYRQEILEDLVKVSREFSPDVVICSTPDDFHQDHEVIGKECMRAFYNATIFTYVCRKGVPYFQPNVFVMLTEDEYLKKKELIHIYESQLAKSPLFEMSHSIMHFYGQLHGKKYAEPFRLGKMII
jgi:LmbE family N-acetylglucosaminyl deacetylase